MLMTACDLSGGTKPWKCHYRVRKYLLIYIVINRHINYSKIKLIIKK